ncbi:MAG: hypothetical protein ACD_35C00063G0001, partial [uncultured bacterium]
MLQSVVSGSSTNYWKRWLSPQCNLFLCKMILSAPSEIIAKVRWWELVGTDLIRYRENPSDEVILLNEFSREVLADILQEHQKGNVIPKMFNISRASFQGEVLVVSGEKDVVFSPEIGRLISSEYPRSRFLLINDGHRMLEHQELMRNLRRTFFESGLNSEP